MRDSGTLRLRAYTSRGQIPVVSATVAVIRRHPGEKLELLALRMTDANGKVEPITIDSPAPSASLSPGNSQPFAVVDILAEHPQYQMLAVEQVQIFPGVETVQDLMMMPLAENASQTEDASLVYITPQNL